MSNMRRISTIITSLYIASISTAVAAEMKITGVIDCGNMTCAITVGKGKKEEIYFISGKPMDQVLAACKIRDKCEIVGSIDENGVLKSVKSVKKLPD